MTRNPSDILLGHTTFDPAGGVSDDWVRDNALSPGEPCHPNTYIMVPILPVQIAEHKKWSPFVDSQFDAARLIFGICGEYWYEQIQALPVDTPIGRIKHKLVRIDMGCEARLFGTPRRYTPESMNGLLHLSDLQPHKGFDLLLDSIDPSRMRLHLGSGNLRSYPNQRLRIRDKEVISLGWMDNSNPQVDHFVKEQCAFYIHTSSLDAQATAILENCARGLVPIVTPESGFRSPHAIYLTQDTARNREIILAAMAMSPAEYEARSAGVVEQIRTNHSWETVFGTVWETIQADMRQRYRA
ncbi:glycosyltransferase [Azospirillum lipoferum]|uniref:glycosyltransferase n=1 Tax=Azospirillum lipoferum TaxID=193 RepID=UPI00147834D4|nr:glycosyltransferase [Azospirillum lipoferum]